MKTSAFTIIELLVVMAIVAILAVVGSVTYMKYVSNARYSRMQTVLEEMKTVAEEFYADYNTYPNGTCNFLDSGTEKNTCDLNELKIEVPGRFCVKFVPVSCSGESGYYLILSSSILKNSSHSGPAILVYRNCTGGGGAASLICSDTEIHGLKGHCSSYSCP